MVFAVHHLNTAAGSLSSDFVEPFKHFAGQSIEIENSLALGAAEGRTGCSRIFLLLWDPDPPGSALASFGKNGRARARLEGWPQSLT